ncbi:MAG: hypothetical protein ACI8WB_005492 [Phenylobacterium sp.]|jgi:hypothetical protein
MEHCRNCENPIINNDSFCGACGQSTKSFDRPAWQVGKDTFHELLDIDGRLFTTLKTLLIKPGLLTLEYNQGKRQKYSPPLRMYLVMSILFFVVFEFFGRDVFVNTPSLLPMQAYYPKIIFVLLPAFAGILQLFYFRTYYISNLIFAIHLHTFVYLVMMLIFPLEQIAESSIIALLVQAILFFYFFGYLLKALKLNYQQNWGWTIAKFIAITTCYLQLLVLSFRGVEYFLL